MQYLSTRRKIPELIVGGLLLTRRLASTQHRNSGYVTAPAFTMVCPLGGPESDPGEDPSARPEPIRWCPHVYASFEDIMVVGTKSMSHLFIISPERFPRRWKVLPKHTGQFVAIARWNNQLLLLVIASTTLLYSFHTRSWITCRHKPRHLFPDSETRPAWFHDSFYVKCYVASEKELQERDRLRSLKSWTLEEEEEDGDEELEPNVYSIMRFDAEEKRWYELELSEGDVQLLSSGFSVPLVLQGRLFVFSAAWGYLHSNPGMRMMDYYVGDEQAETSWDGCSNPFKVFRLEDDPARDGWSGASVSQRKNMKKLVDVTRVEFGKLVETAWIRKAAKFFTGDGDDVLFWINFDNTLDRYDISGDELLGRPAGFRPMDPSIKPNSTGFSTLLHLVHQDPGRQDTFFSLFQDLPEINDSTSVEEIRRLEA